LDKGGFMEQVLMLFIAGCALLAAIFAFLSFLRAGKDHLKKPNSELFEAIRAEIDRSNQVTEANARGLRLELNQSLLGYQETALRSFTDLGDVLGKQIKGFGEVLNGGVKAIAEGTAAIARKLDEDISKMGKEANQHREALREVIEHKLDDASSKQATAAKDAREEITSSFTRLGGNVNESLTQSSQEQKERLTDVTKALSVLTEKQTQAQESLKEAVERRLDTIREANEAKLEEMRKTVDEKLQSTLEARLGESFKLVSDQLLKVSAGLGEMQQLATGVGDLKRVLTQVKPRGVWGEAQLESLLEDFLAPDQFARNVAVRPDSAENVEFAIRLPKLSDGHGEVYLPIDAKFPHEPFERLVTAAEDADPIAVEEAARTLERAIKLQARNICDKYIVPPSTTDYAILFLPSEALYAEVARRPGLVESVTRECSVMIAGPSTLIALLNAIRVGFRSALIHKQAGEISKLLQKVRTEFDKYGAAVQTAARRAASTVDAIAKLQTRQNVMGRALKGVELLSADTPIDAASMLIDLETHSIAEDEQESDN
jgi:DNA recombination protein RmuC